MTAVTELAQQKAAAPGSEAGAVTRGRSRSRARASAPDGARRCLVTGEMRPRAELIRFVIGPEDAVVPDLSENLPGHGLWVTATAEHVQTALKKNLFSKAAKAIAHPPATLVEDVQRLLRKRCLDLMGLAKGAGLAVLGEKQVEDALRAGKLALYLHAADAMRTQDNNNKVAECDVFTRLELGASFGYDQIVYAGLLPHGLTVKLKLEIGRLQSMMVLPQKHVIHATNGNT